MKRVEVETYTAQVYIGGSFAEACRVAQDYCDSVGLCVTVEPVSYIYTDGSTDGVRVGLINYGRFPSNPDAVFGHAEKLANILIYDLGQQTATIIATDRSVWLTRRPDDLAPSTPTDGATS